MQEESKKADSPAKKSRLTLFTIKTEKTPRPAKIEPEIDLRRAGVFHHPRAVARAAKTRRTGMILFGLKTAPLQSENRRRTGEGRTVKDNFLADIEIFYDRSVADRASGSGKCVA